jgi:hypothetical protein
VPSFAAQAFQPETASANTDEMSDLYSTVPQRQIQAAVGAVISLAKYRELLQDGASCGGKVVGKVPKLATATPRSRGKWPSS